MSIDVRALPESRFREADDLFAETLHLAPRPAEQWHVVSDTYQPGRVLGASDGERLVGHTLSFGSRMLVPGGTTAPMAGVTFVGVRADATRRGVLTAMMRAQLADIAARGEVFASLRASEYPIYARFGYGVATRGRSFQVDVRGAALHPGAPAGGPVRLLRHDEILATLPAIHDRVGLDRPAAMHRPESWWTRTLGRRLATGNHLMAAVHTGDDGDDGFVVWARREGEGGFGSVAMDLRDLVAADVSATAGLWRFLLGIDLVATMHAWLRPLDDVLTLLLADPRQARTTGIDDEVWLRLVDVPSALAARRYGDADPLVLEVSDPVLAANAGRYRIGPDGAARTVDTADLAMDVGQLARMYLGDVTPSALAAAGWVQVRDPTAPARADRLFASDVVPWCGTFF